MNGERWMMDDGEERGERVETEEKGERGEERREKREERRALRNPALRWAPSRIELGHDSMDDDILNQIKPR